MRGSSNRPRMVPCSMSSSVTRLPPKSKMRVFQVVRGKGWVESSMMLVRPSRFLAIRSTVKALYALMSSAIASLSGTRVRSISARVVR